LHRPDRSSDLASRPRMISICLDLMAFLFSRQRFDSILLSFETSSSQSKKWNGIEVSEPCMSVDRLVSLCPWNSAESSLCLHLMGSMVWLVTLLD
jgi:hypothetical protein